MMAIWRSHRGTGAVSGSQASADKTVRYAVESVDTLFILTLRNFPISIP